MENNENLVPVEGAENVEQTTEQTPKYTEAEFNAKLDEVIGKKIARKEAKIRKEYETIFESCDVILTPTAPRCPHLGCALKYNRAEHTWDCPCHGSRFTEDGQLIDNPATDHKKM